MTHLLLVVVLALGVFVMHTVGHPDDSSGATGMSAGSHAPHSPIHAAPEPDHATTPMPLPSTMLGAPTPEHGGAADHHGNGSGMDMSSLCMAVLLGAWALAALLSAAFARGADRLADLLAHAVVLLRPNPPPRIPLLTQLSILRI